MCGDWMQIVALHARLSAVFERFFLCPIGTVRFFFEIEHEQRLRSSICASRTRDETSLQHASSMCIM